MFSSLIFRTLPPAPSFWCQHCPPELLQGSGQQMRLSNLRLVPITSSCPIVTLELLAGDTERSEMKPRVRRCC